MLRQWTAHFMDALDARKIWVDRSSFGLLSVSVTGNGLMDGFGRMLYPGFGRGPREATGPDCS